MYVSSVHVLTLVSAPLSVNQWKTSTLVQYFNWVYAFIFPWDSPRDTRYFPTRKWALFCFCGNAILWNSPSTTKLLPSYHNAPFVFFLLCWYNISVGLCCQPDHSTITTALTHQGRNLRSRSEKRWGRRAVGQRMHTSLDHADVELLMSCKKPELCKYEIKQLKILQLVVFNFKNQQVIP